MRGKTAKKIRKLVMADTKIEAKDKTYVYRKAKKGLMEVKSSGRKYV